MDTVQLKEETLKRLLERLGIDESRYSLRAGLPNGGYAMARRGPKWVVYRVSDRGGEDILARFGNQQSAVERLVSLLLRDLDARQEEG